MFILILLELLLFLLLDIIVLLLLLLDIIVIYVPLVQHHCCYALLLLKVIVLLLLFNVLLGFFYSMSLLFFVHFARNCCSTPFVQHVDVFFLLNLLLFSFCSTLMFFLFNIGAPLPCSTYYFTPLTQCCCSSCSTLLFFVCSGNSLLLPWFCCSLFLLFDIAILVPLVSNWYPPPSLYSFKCGGVVQFRVL